MEKPPASSPFTKTEFQDIETSVSKKAKHFAFKTKDGKILVNFNDATSYAYLKQLATISNCELILVSGTWTFTPDRIDDAN